VLFFAFYIVIGLLYVQRQTAHRRPFVDGTLVFGTPLVASRCRRRCSRTTRWAWR
jgi:hypothetical protein